jgi:hypothetical protein
LPRTAGVIHNSGFTHGLQDLLYAFLPLIHSCLSHLCTASTSDFDGPRLMGYSYVCSSITSLPI